MPNRASEPFPSHEMPAQEPVRSRKTLYITALIAAACLFLLFRGDPPLFEALWGDAPFSWNAFASGFKKYGHWLFSLYVAFTAVVLFFENRNPDRTIAWLLALALIPVAGFLLYWLVGPNFRYLADKKRFRLPKPTLSPDDLPDSAASALAEDTMQLLYRTAGARLAHAKDATLFFDGASYFAHLKSRLRSARRGILLESYIIENDATGGEIRDILIERARAGVLVCVIYDAVGSWHIGKEYLRALREGGVYAYAFLPVAFPMFRGAHFRNHRKILVVDGEFAFTGGMNIGDAYAGRDTQYSQWRDTHMEVSGAAVEGLRALFLNDLAICGAPASVAKLAEETTSLLADSVPRGEGVPMQIVGCGPDTAWDGIHKAYMSLISRARQRLWLTTPYLVPGEALMEAICMASLSGVDVRMLLPGKGDHPLVQWASMNWCDELLRSGVRVFLYDPSGFVHAKTITCDSEIVSVGSANVDMRSLHINFEIQAFVYDKRLALEAEAVFEEDMGHSKELTFHGWRKRPRIKKLQESIGKLFSSLL